MVLFTFRMSATVAEVILELISLTEKLISGLVIPDNQLSCPRAPLRRVFSTSTSSLEVLLVSIEMSGIGSKLST